MDGGGKEGERKDMRQRSSLAADHRDSQRRWGESGANRESPEKGIRQRKTRDKGNW